MSVKFPIVYCLFVLSLGSIFGGSSIDCLSSSVTVAASGKVLIPGGQSDGLSSSADSVADEQASDDLQVQASNVTIFVLDF